MFFNNFENRNTDGYNFLKIINCEKTTRGNNQSEKLIIIPKNTITIGPHMVFSGKPMFTVSDKDMFLNHYFFLNKKDRGLEETEYTDNSILSKQF